MPSADVTVQDQTQVGLISPTGLQALLILLKLYESADTDRQTWIATLESHPLPLRSVIAAKPLQQLEQWHESFSLEELQRLTINLANEVDPMSIPVSLEHLQQTASIGRSICNLVDPLLTRKCELTCRLLRSGIATGDASVKDALLYAGRELESLVDSPLLTRLVAAAVHCSGDGDIPVENCARLLSVDTDKLREALAAYPPNDAGYSTARMAEEFATLKGAANLVDASLALARQTSRELAVRAAAAGLLGSASMALFLQHEGRWRSDSGHFAMPHSAIVQAAASGQVVSIGCENTTVTDEQLLASLGGDSGYAVPISIDEQDNPVCVAVALIAGENHNPPNTMVLGKFNLVCRHLYSTQLQKGVDPEMLDRRAREIIHEANNPISTVQNYLKVLSLKLGPDHAAQGTLESISSELFRAAGIIRSFNELKHGAQELGTADVNKIVRQISSLFEQGQSSTFEYRLDESSPLAGMPANHLKQVLTNLVKNATECTGDNDTITVSTSGNLRQGDGVFVEVSVRDTGPGISSDLPNVFDRGVTSKTGDHAGEGLAIVHDLTEAAGGFASYRSDNNGTEFRITIPQIKQR